MYNYSLSAPPPATELHKVKAPAASNQSSNPNLPPQAAGNPSPFAPRIIVKPSPNFKMNMKVTKSQADSPVASVQENKPATGVPGTLTKVQQTQSLPPVKISPQPTQPPPLTQTKVQLSQPPPLTQTKVQLSQPPPLTQTKVQLKAQQPPLTPANNQQPSLTPVNNQQQHSLKPVKKQMTMPVMTHKLSTPPIAPTNIQQHPPFIPTKVQPSKQFYKGPTKAQISQPPSVAPTKVQMTKPSSPTQPKMTSPPTQSAKIQHSQPPSLALNQQAPPLTPTNVQMQKTSFAGPVKIQPLFISQSQQVPTSSIALSGSPQERVQQGPSYIQQQQQQQQQQSISLNQPQEQEQSHSLIQQQQQQSTLTQSKHQQKKMQFMGAYRTTSTIDTSMSNSTPTLPSYTGPANAPLQQNLIQTREKSAITGSDGPAAAPQRERVGIKQSRRHLAIKYETSPIEFLIGGMKTQTTGPSQPSSALAPSASPPPAAKVALNLTKEEEEELEHARAYLQQYKSQIEIESETAGSSNSDMKSIGNCARLMSASESDYCMLCGKAFTMILRRHNCLKCGKLFCSDCTAWNIEQPELSSKGPIRVCAQCYCSHVESGGAQTLFGASKTQGTQVRIEEESDGKAKTPGEGGVKEESGGGPQKEREADLQNLPEDKEERLRYRCVHEVIDTEKTYVEDLNTLITVYMYPIKLTGILNQEQVDGIFSNIEMLEPVHSELLQKLTDDEYTKGGEYIGEAFKTICQYLKMYTLYCANHEHATKIIDGLKGNAEFQKTLAICQTDPRTKGENLASYIIKPIQRICKYPLFFREIISHTSQDHSDYALLVETKEKIDDVVKSINEGKRRLEQQQKMVEILNSVDGNYEGDGLITPSRVWISDIKLQGREDSGSKVGDYMLYLFNDLILVTKITVSKKHQLKMYVPLNEAVITVVVDTEKDKNCFEISRKNHDARYKFFAESDSQKNDIVKLMKSTQKELQKMILTGKILNKGPAT